MAPVVVFPDAAAVVIVELAARLGVTVVSKVPKVRPAPLVLVRRLGGPKLNLVADDAQLGIECWAATEAEAHDLAQLARAYIHAMRGGVYSDVAVYRVAEFAGPQLLPDPMSDLPRFVFTVQVAMRGQAGAT